MKGESFVRPYKVTYFAPAKLPPITVAAEKQQQLSLQNTYILTANRCFEASIGQDKRLLLQLSNRGSALH